MGESGAYGDRLRRVFKLETAPSFVAKTLRNAQVAVTEIRCDRANTGLSEPIPLEDSFLLTVQLRDVPAHGLFIDGRRVETAYLKAGTASFYDLRSSPVADSLSPFHHLSFYIPRAALVAIADREGIAVADSFSGNPGVGMLDPTLYNLAQAILPCLQFPDRSSPIFVDHVTVAAVAHAIKGHAGRRRPATRASGRPSGQDIARAKERLAASIDGNLALADLSAASGMSPLAFAASFKQIVGTDIHTWRGELRSARGRQLAAQGDHAEAIDRQSAGNEKDRSGTNAWRKG